MRALAGIIMVAVIVMGSVAPGGIALAADPTLNLFPNQDPGIDATPGRPDPDPNMEMIPGPNDQDPGIAILPGLRDRDLGNVGVDDRLQEQRERSRDLRR